MSMIMRKIRNKRAQEEMIGFIMIVILVIIVLLVILGISLRKEKRTERTSVEISQFLSSMAKYTTDCAISFEPAFLELRELVEECYSHYDSDCLNGKNVCNSMNSTIREILDKSWKASPENAVKGYAFAVSEISGDSPELIVKIEKGCSSGSIRGGEYSTAELSLLLELCY